MGADRNSNTAILCRGMSAGAATRKHAVRFLQLQRFDTHPVKDAQRDRLSGVLTSENCMECTCIRHTELPNTSKLFADFVYHFDRVSSYYPHSPFDPAAYAAAAAQINLPDDRRAALVS